MMRIGSLAGALLILLAVLCGVLFIAGFPIIARTTGGAYGGWMPGWGMMPGGMPMQPGQMPRVQPIPQPGAPGATPAPNSGQPQIPGPWMMPGWQQMPYGGMPMMRNRGMAWRPGLFGGGFGFSIAIGRTALACTGILAGAAAFTALGYVLGRRSALAQQPVTPGRPGEPVEPAP